MCGVVTEIKNYNRKVKQIRGNKIKNSRVDLGLLEKDHRTNGRMCAAVTEK